MSQWGTRPSPFSSAEVIAIRALIGGGVSYTDGQLLIGSTADGLLHAATLTQGAGITITNAGGSITIAAAGSTMTVGSSAIIGGTSTRILYDNAGTLGEYTISGSGTVVAMATSPSFTTPTLGVATATSINKMAITAPATSSTLAVADGKTFTVSNTITLAGTDAQTYTFPSTSATIARTDAANTFTGHQTIEGVTSTGATGTGKFVFDTSPTLATPVLGVATATSINKMAITAPATSSTLAVADGKTFTASNTITLAAGADSQTFTFPSTSGTVAMLNAAQTFTAVNIFTPAARSSGSASYFTINAPADIGITTTAESIGINHVGATRTWVDGTVATQREYLFQAPTYNKTTTSATFTKAATLAISAAPTAGTGVTITNAYALWVQAGLAQFDGTLTVTGHVTLEGVTSTGATGTNLLVFATSPTLTTPTIGVATATSINKVAITAPATSATLTIADGKTATVSNSITFAGTDSTTMTFPSTTATIARTDAAQTFTGTQTFAQIVTTNNAITASANAATVPITSRISTVTNNSAATLTITITTTSAVDGQMVIVRILDFSAVAQTVAWVNTENSTVTAPTTSNGSTTLPLTVGFQYNAGTSKWRCIASA